MQDNQTPMWLKKVQDNSWEPEIIISGLTVAFFFLLPNHIYNFCSMLVQDLGANVTISTYLYGFSIIIITALKVLFIGHLILRGLWTGLVGLSYVFPDGIRNELLPKRMQHIKYDKPAELVIKVEKICSLIFSFAFSIVLMVILSLSLYIIIILINILFRVFNLDNSIMSNIEMIMIGLVFIVTLLMLTVFKNSKVTQMTHKGLYTNIHQTFSTNLGKKKTILLFMGFTILIYTLSYSKISEFKFDVRKSRKIQESEYTIYNNEYYFDSRNNDLRVMRASLNSFVAANKLQLYISMYRENEDLTKQINKEFEMYSAIMPGKIVNEINTTDIYIFYIDDKDITPKEWIITKGVHTKQKFLLTEIPTDSLDSGFHNLKINRIRWKNRSKKFTITENWMNIPFKKESITK